MASASGTAADSAPVAGPQLPGGEPVAGAPPTASVTRLELPPAPGEVTLVVHARNEAELEAWMVRRKQDLFERTFHVSLELGVESGARREYDALAEGSGLG